MAVIAPFRALLLDLDRASSDGAIDLSQTSPSEFAVRLSDLRGSGTLITDTQPAIYAFRQSSTFDSHPRTTTGLLALLHLEASSGLNSSAPQESGCLLRVQHSLSASIRSEIEFLCTARHQSAPALVLYDGAAIALPTAAPPGYSICQKHACHKNVALDLWRVTDADAISQITTAISTRSLVLASGHAAYDAALALRDETTSAAYACASPEQAPRDWMMAAFVHDADPGLISRPVHRVVSGLEHFETGEFVRITRANFFFREVSRHMRHLPPTSPHPVLAANGPHFDSDVAARLLAAEEATSTVTAVTAEDAGARVVPGVARNSRVEPGDVVMLAVTRDCTYRLHSKPGWADTILAHIPPVERQLDVVQLHKIILEKVLKISESESDVREQRHVTFHAEPTEAVEQVRLGANVAFILNPLGLERLREVALSGAVLPPCSIDVQPLPPKGVIFYGIA
ncbi:MAG TPA: DUF1015 family protein [Clostridia bacterium]|nr:DUF1015 family protein [Clostridia bacterium]